MKIGDKARVKGDSGMWGEITWINGPGTHATISYILGVETSKRVEYIEVYKPPKLAYVDDKIIRNYKPKRELREYWKTACPCVCSKCQFGSCLKCRFEG